MWKIGPWQGGILRGEPKQVAGWTLTPIALAAAFTRRRASLTADAVQVIGAQFAAIRPLAVQAEREGRRQALWTPDVTNLLLLLIGLVGAASTVGLAVRRRRRA